MIERLKLAATFFTLAVILATFLIGAGFFLWLTALAIGDEI